MEEEDGAGEKGAAAEEGADSMSGSGLSIVLENSVRIRIRIKFTHQ